MQDDERLQFKPMNREHLMETLEQLAHDEAAAEEREKRDVETAAHHTLSMGARSPEDLTPTQREFGEHMKARSNGESYRGRGIAYSNSNRTFSIPTHDRE